MRQNRINSSWEIRTKFCGGLFVCVFFCHKRLVIGVLVPYKLASETLTETINEQMD